MAIISDNMLIIISDRITQKLKLTKKRIFEKNKLKLSSTIAEDIKAATLQENTNKANREN